MSFIPSVCVCTIIVFIVVEYLPDDSRKRPKYVEGLPHVRVILYLECSYLYGSSDVCLPLFGSDSEVILDYHSC